MGFILQVCQLGVQYKGFTFWGTNPQPKGLFIWVMGTSCAVLISNKEPLAKHTLAGGQVCY